MRAAFGRLLLACLLCSRGPVAAPAQAGPTPPSPPPAPRSVRATRITGAPPTIDGRLDEPVWMTAEGATGFIQNGPDVGAPASERTEARVLYDDEAIYVGMWLYDQHPDSIRKQLSRRDQSGGASDEVAVLIDSYHDRRTGFVFRLTASGTKTDLIRYNDASGSDPGWDPVWAGQVHSDSLGWTAEFRIPLSQLRFSAQTRAERPTPRSGAGADADSLAQGQTWGINFWRQIQRRGELAFWSPTPPNAPGFVSMFGELKGLAGLRSPRRFEVLPYSMGRLTRAPGTTQNPFYRKNDPFGGGGADVKYGLTSGLTASATLNPDFGQVEADPSVVNLSAFESFFSERRPFFIEGANLFQFPGAQGDGSAEPLLYPRRVGRAPQRSVSSTGGYVAAPASATIFGAAKISGRTRSGWSLAAMEAATAAEYARVVDAQGARREEEVEPFSNYLVARGSRDLNRGQTVVGGAFTSTNRDLSNPALALTLRSAAYTGGVDFRHRFGARRYETRGWLAASRVRGTDSAIAQLQRASAHFFQRSDARHLTYDPTRTALSGLAGYLGVGKVGGGHWTWGSDVLFRSPDFEVNDLGFMGSADYVQSNGYVSYDHFEPTRRFRNWSAGISENVRWSFGGELLSAGVSANAFAQLKNLWGGNVFASRDFPARSASALRGGPALRTPGGTSFGMGGFSDGRKRLSGSLFVSAQLGDDPEDGSLYVSPFLSFRPSSRMDVSVSSGISLSENGWQYVSQAAALGKTRYLFAHLRQTTVYLTARVNYLFTRDLSLQLYAQPFVSAGVYDRLREVADPQASTFGGRFHTFAGGEIAYDAAGRLYRLDLNGDGASDLTVENPDFNFKQVRSNVVLRWEYRPGSTLFVVWTHGRTSRHVDGSFALRRDLDRLFSSPATNVLLVKLSYWLSL